MRQLLIQVPRGHGKDCIIQAIQSHLLQQGFYVTPLINVNVLEP